MMSMKLISNCIACHKYRNTNPCEPLFGYGIYSADSTILIVWLIFSFEFTNIISQPLIDLLLLLIILMVICV